MNWYEKLNSNEKSEVNMLCGALNLPNPQEYTDLSTFLHTVRAAHCEASSLIRQAAKILNV